MARTRLMPQRLTVLLGVGALLMCGCNGSPRVSETTAEVVIAGERFTLELALTPEQRYRGLSGRESIPPDGGMLFVFPDHRVGIKQFVMRDCLVPIDIIFLDPAGRVVKTHAMRLEPPGTPESDLPRYSSEYPAQFAIELAGGRAAELGVQPGQKLDVPAAELKRRAE